MTNLTFIGAGGHGKVAADVARAAGWKDSNFLDQAFPKQKTNGDWSVVAHTDDISKYVKQDKKLFASIGNNRIRQEVSSVIPSHLLVNLIHPDACISVGAKLGFGILIVAGVIVNVDAHIGHGTILNTACTIDHDCRIGEFVHISPGANLAGNVTIGDQSWIGIGATVREGIIIGKNVKVAAGAVVVKDIPDGTTVLGVPARAV